MDRRDVLAGLGCAAALGTAEFLRPRRKIVLMPSGAKLEDLVPKVVDGWTSGPTDNIVIPRTEGSLAAKLYAEQLALAYHHAGDDKPNIMVLAAYGAAQNDSLQLHRPEVCYPAIGFEIVDRRFVDIPAGGGKQVPAVALTAKSGSRVEDIVSWTRMGNALPRTMSEQRADRFRSALAGYVGDGILFRSSAVRQSDAPLFDNLVFFLSELIGALRPQGRLGLLGQSYAA
jgi:EpsI family protein